MPVLNGVGTIGWPGFSISNRNSWVPTYGNWGGPDWSGGQRGGNPLDPSVGQVSPCLNGLGQKSLVDAACKEHDFAYVAAKGQVNEAELISKADLDLLQALNSIPISQMDATEMAYTLLATDAFAGMLLGIDLPAEIREKVINTANEILDKLQGMLPQDLKDFVDSITSGNLLTDGIKLNNIINNLLGLFGSAAGAAPPPSCPIVLDLDKDGVKTTNITNGAYFDHDNNGFAEKTGWASSDDGLLVMDRNGNGTIDNGTELFGNETLLQNGQKAANGFQALAELDTNSDGKIDANDAAYTQLRIWQDIDGNGYSATDELFALNELGIQSINTGYNNSTFIDANNNEHKQVGSFTWTDNTTGTATDVWFKADKTYTIANEWLDVPDDIAALPDLQGYGNVYDLQQAMVREERMAI